ncbi:2908_t:CDS:10 [Diversispora eburnea]|uniref:DNA polymerase epsilon catalytic subunit n=1 Tax=Diversispora eburnea TaxID=1213867 RepID=A0A9N8ZKM4_9GLOM|nr:2908_t:CDS:10 [Diversispora eburnea]
MFTSFTSRNEYENIILEKLGYTQYDQGPSRLGWLYNTSQSLVQTSQHKTGKSAVDLFFLESKGISNSYFRCKLSYFPYFFVQSRTDKEKEVSEYLLKKYEQYIHKVSVIEKQDLKKANHLVDGIRKYIKIEFWNTHELLIVRNKLLKIVKENQKGLEAIDVYEDHLRYGQYGKTFQNPENNNKNNEPVNNIIDIREYDIPYCQRAAMDLDLRVGRWYKVKAFPQEGGTRVILRHQEEIMQHPNPIVLAYDIETSKKPLNFPDADFDSIMMISYMVDGRGYLITNREIVSEDIEEIEYSPTPAYEGHFKIFNELNEEALLKRFFTQIKQEKPTIITTYNGDSFDWPFVERRAEIFKINMQKEIGFTKSRGVDNDEYTSKQCAHIDCFQWVKRDSYLPIGSQGLKRVTEAKLGYNPDELDPEVMTEYAETNPQTLARYSVSDAVEAYRANIIMPNKHVNQGDKFFNDHPLQDETYIGGHVDALEAGVFRSDISVNFNVDSQVIRKLMIDIDDLLKFAIWEASRETDENLKETVFNVDNEDVMNILAEKICEITNYNEVRSRILSALEELRESKQQFVKTPLIYHLDVAAMYPNIILTNRLQPDSMITEDVCLRCDYNVPGKTCDRKMTWSWRGEYYPAKKDEYNMIKNQMVSENFPSNIPEGKLRTYQELSSEEQSSFLKKRLGDYCQKAYKKKKETKVQQKEALICQRENPFYVNTVLNFRDLRYAYKAKVKEWKNKLSEAIKNEDLVMIDEAKKMIVQYDSLQLAHKCILNSFYGYVMRKGSRWYSMEMAGVVCDTGSKIIQMARKLIEKIGRPLELDTDGIWCILPSNFPENYKFKLSSGKSLTISFPCAMLNYLVHLNFTNDQYHNLSSNKMKYELRKENSIFFEVDGPYRAMILPASLEENKLLKKRYAVFAPDGTLQELKGFEMKRRGELKLLKNFQECIFQDFLKGKTLEECYNEVGKTANAFLDIIEYKGTTLPEKILIEYISEKRSMSRSYEDYGIQKSTAITAAKRLTELLGDHVKANKLTCNFVISARPPGLPVSERVIPVAIFSAENDVKINFLRKWTADPNMDNFDVRNILDWNYYHERLGKTIQKLITIPAASQDINNPVPRLKHPEWLCKRLSECDSKQRRITDMFRKVNDETNDIDAPNIDDIENFGIPKSVPLLRAVVKKSAKKKCDVLSLSESKENELDLEMDIDPQEENLQTSNGKRIDDEDSQNISVENTSRSHITSTKGKKQINTNKTVEGHNVANNIDKISLEKFFNKEVIWEILQIDETKTPGDFIMWVLIGRALQSIRLIVPRRFFINYKSKTLPKEINEMTGIKGNVAKVNRTLPRSQERFNLFEVNMLESTYKENKYFLDNIFNDPLTEGVYETQVSLLDRALIEVGNMINKHSAKAEVLKSAFRKGLDIRNIKRPENYELYLQDQQINYLYLYHIMSGDRQIYGLFSTRSNKAKIFFVGKGTTASNYLFRNMSSKYKSSLENLQDNCEIISEIFKVYDELAFEVVPHLDNTKQFTKDLTKILREYQNERHGPTIFVMQSPYNCRDLIEEGVKVLREFPTMNIKSNDTFQTFDWQEHAVELMFVRYFQVGSIIKNKIVKAKDANLPLCNINEDNEIFTIDILFARRLIKGDVILWWSNSPKPDLGSGREQDEYLHPNDELDYDFCSNNPGVYKSLCFEIKLNNLILNTILESSSINQIEGTSRIFGDEIPQATFTALKTMVKDWFNEGYINNNKFAKDLIQNLESWLRTNESKFYDHTIYGLMRLLMKKVMQLMGEIKKLGDQVIYGNFYKIIIASPKRRRDLAMTYQNSFKSYIQRKPVFKSLELDFRNIWTNILWIDPKNFSSTLLHHPNYVDKKWTIVDLLPEQLQSKFDALMDDILNFITNPINYEFKRSLLRRDILVEVENAQKVHNEGILFLNLICAVIEVAIGPDESWTNKQNCCNLLRISAYTDNVKKFKLENNLKVGNIECTDCKSIQAIDIGYPNCINCDAKLNPSKLQFALLEFINNQIGKFQTQDLICSKCKLIREGNLRKYCECGSEFQSTVNADDIIKLITRINELAQKNRFELLEETCEWLLNT